MSSYSYSPTAQSIGRVLGAMNQLLYGAGPSVTKFYTLEIIALVPYAIWWLLSEHKSMPRAAYNNEARHLLAMHELLKNRPAWRLLNGLLAVGLALGYSLLCAGLFLIKRRWAYELNALFEEHAYAQYQAYLDLHQQTLSPELHQLFTGIRDDELLHRDHSLELAAACK